MGKLHAHLRSHILPMMADPTGRYGHCVLHIAGAAHAVTFGYRSTRPFSSEDFSLFACFNVRDSFAIFSAIAPITSPTRNVPPIETSARHTVVENVFSALMPNKIAIANTSN